MRASVLFSCATILLALPAMADESPGATLKAADGGQGDAFGSSIAMDGDTAVIGSGYFRYLDTGGRGVAYVYVRSGTSWSLQAELKPDEAANTFGDSVAISGDTVVVGLSGGTNAQRAGLAYVFVRANGKWTKQAVLIPPDGHALNNDRFGSAVAISGDTLAVGSPDGGYTYRGLVYIYVRTNGVWSLETELSLGFL